MNPTIEIVEPLLKWFYQHARVLPWREEATPYRVWVSEIMLQQTRVEAVKPYFERFIKRLPTIQDLAIVEEDELLKLWEGLGYYNRARNLQKAAQIVVECYQGSLPNEYSELMRLPGIGSYTAGAISSIAYQKVEPAVDGNVLRVIARVTANLSNILDLKVKSMLEKNIREIIPSTCPGDFNQALMELGATVCLPNGAPKCEECPWYHLCEARKQEKISDIPYKEQKKKRVIEEKTVLILQDDNKVAIQKRPNKGLLAGLYDFPNVKGKWTTDEVVHYLK